MRKYLLLSLMALLPMTALITVTSCGGDDEVVQPPVDNNANNDKDGSSGNNGENLDIHVVVNDDGTTSNGSIFSAIDNQNFYVDYIKYTVTEGHLAVSGYDNTGFKGIAKIISKLTYKGNTYEVLEIKKSSFEYCRSLTSVTIPNSVTSIGSSAFRDCTSLTSITIGSGVTSIDGSAFGGCTSLTSIVVESGNTVYDSRNDCNAIIETETNTMIGGCKNTIIPNSVTRIGEYAFYKCTSLTSTTIPNSVTSIGSYAFYDCYRLTSVTIPNSVTRIGNDAFLGCTSLTAVHINDIAAWCKIMYYGIYYRGGSVNPLYYAEHLYLNGEELKDLTIPNSVTSIGDYAFMGCSGLTSVTIPNSVTRIGEYAFYKCSSLTSIAIGSGVTSIGYDAFYYCTSLTDVYCYAENVPSTDSDAFEYSSISSATLHVPAGSIEAYRTTDPWSSFSRIVAIE